MKKVIHLIFILLIIEYWFSTCFAQDSGSNKPKIYALVIGISDYKDSTINKLQFAHKDATIFANFLKSEKGGSVPEENIRLLTNQQADIASIHNALDWLKGQVEENDKAYFYFSGHGDVETKKDKKLGYLIAYNSPPNNYTNNAISLMDLNQDANFISLEKKGKMVLVLDACHSGVLAGDFFKGKNLVNKQLQTVLNNEVRLTACGVGELAAESSDWGGGRGVFSYYLINGFNGLADQNQDNVIKLKELRAYMDSCFVNDSFLKSLSHKQMPVLDGNPTYPLSFGENKSFTTFKSNFLKTPTVSSFSSRELSNLPKISPQPIDKFFNWLDSTSIELIINFKKYEQMSSTDFAKAFVDDVSQINSEAYVNQLKKLLPNKPFQKRFTENFVECVHRKGQEKINNYLNGNLAEIRKRDYYNLKKEEYLKFLALHQIALRLVPEEHSLAKVMKINYNYLTGLIARASMPISQNPDSLLNVAFIFQKEAYQLEENAAYINNELGILYLYKKDFNTAEKYFKSATEISPTWAIPYINLISVSFAQKNLPKARAAINKAEELQPNFEYKQMNAGLVMELENNWLAAESNYQLAIKKNKEHYFPYERLGNVYIEKAEFMKAQTYFEESEKIIPGFVEVFKNGPVLLVGTDIKMKKRYESCSGFDTKRKELRPIYDGFEAALGRIRLMWYDSNLVNAQIAIDQIKLGLKSYSKMPLAKHILGKMLYSKGEWQQALDLIIEAKKEYKDDNDLKKELISVLSIDSTSKSDNCLLDFFAFFQYEPLEDDYLLAELYQKLGQSEKAIEQYKSMVIIENNRQEKGEILKYQDSYPSYDESNSLASFKLSQLYEKLEKYDLAESTLKEQIRINFSLSLNRSTRDTYWEDNNSIYEGAIRGFYERMIEKEPRNYQWPEKLGFWIYNFLNVSIESYIYFMNYNGKLYFNKIGVNINSRVLGTDETISFGELPNPNFVAYKYLNESIKLTGEEKPKVEVLLALANLAPWVGQYDEAIAFHHQVLLQEENITSRNNLIQLYNYKMRNPEALAQLKALHAQNQLTKEQKLQFVQYLMLSNEKKEAIRLLEKMDSLSVDNLVRNYQLYYNLWGNENKTNTYLKKGLNKIYSDKVEALNEYEKILMNNENLYIKARQFALRNQNNKALYWLKKSIYNGFSYRLVLDKDIAWEKLKTSNEWEEILKQLNLQAAQK